MAKAKRNPADATTRNVRHGNKRDDAQDHEMHRFMALTDDRLTVLERRAHDSERSIEKLEKKVKKLKKGTKHGRREA